MPILAVAAGCPGPEVAEPDPPETLLCPAPGELPFEAVAPWQDPSNAGAAEVRTRWMHEPADRLFDGTTGLPTTLSADEPAVPTTDTVGRMASSEPDAALVTGGFGGEGVSLWTFDGTWRELDSGATDPEGHYALRGPVPEGLSRTYAVLEPAGTCAIHVSAHFPPGTPIVVTDIDATLTASDLELLMTFTDPDHVPAMMPDADRLIRVWAERGVLPVYLTARPHVFRAETRAWLDAHGFPDGPLITNAALEIGSGNADYKATWLERIDSLGWAVQAAYGNSATDIEAYAAAGIPPERTWIIGEQGGTGGTRAVEGSWEDVVEALLAE